MNIKEKGGAFGGVFNIKVYRNVEEYNSLNAVPIYEITAHNKMTNASLAVISGLVFNTGAQTAFNYLALGSGNNAVSAASTALQTEFTTLGLSRTTATPSQITTAQANDTGKLSATFTASGSGTINEIGIFNGASLVSSIMLCRALTGAISFVATNIVVTSYSWQAVGN